MNHFAYIDAGTGSLFIQAVFGVGLASVVVLRKNVSKAVNKTRLAFSRKEITDEDS